MKISSIIKIVLIVIVTLIIFHFKKYNKSSDGYEIEQQELDYIKGDELYNISNPLIITFIEKNTLKYNIQTYRLFSPLSIDFKYRNINVSENYYSHSGEIMLIRPNKDIKIELINPKYSRFFDKIDKSNLVKYKLDEKNYDKVASIEIILHEYNILFVPRFWLLNISNNDSNSHIEVFTCHSIFTYLFNIIN